MRACCACAIFAIFVYAGCSPRFASGSVTPTMPSGIFKIRHIVWIMQENRSFDNLFQGYPGADTRSSGEDSQGRVVPLAPIAFTRGLRHLSHVELLFPSLQRYVEASGDALPHEWV